MKNADKNIPTQKQGRRTDFATAKEYPDQVIAHKAFLSAKAKLLNIVNWHTYSGSGSAKFGLTDDKGIILHRLAELGDHFFVDLPATPGPDAGDGLEGVIIEQIIEDGKADSLEESVTMIVRPTNDPAKNEGKTAHFFSAESTSTFIVARYQNKISAEVHRRNEEPNTKDVDTFDAIRNTLLALSARLGLSGMQWQKLTDGLLAE